MSCWRLLYMEMYNEIYKDLINEYIYLCTYILPCSYVCKLIYIYNGNKIFNSAM